MMDRQGAEEDDMDDDDEPRHEEGMGRWFVRLGTGKLPVYLGDDYRRRKSLVWPSEDDDLTSSP